MSNVYIIINGLLYLLVLSSIEGDARRCFQCTNVATPQNCEHITDCNAEEQCFTEQLVTSSGNVVYSTGCASNIRCSATKLPLIGKRFGDSAYKRDTNISICTECCSEDFCNIKGCGISETPLEQRGPFCFNCDSMTDPNDCKRVALCIQSEVCIIYPEVIQGSQSTQIRSRCTAKSTCDTPLQSFTGNTCAPYCCNTDFCNNQCGIHLTTSTVKQTVNPTSDAASTYTTLALTGSTVGVQEKSTTAVDVFLTSSLPITTRSTFQCNLQGGYFMFQKGNVNLCIRIGNLHYTWPEARHKCKHQGADLVVLDTYEKAYQLRHYLLKHYAQAGYWIGLKDFSHNNIFEWVNERPVDAKEADWGYDQPDGYRKGIHQHCVAMYRNSDYRWHDQDCLLNDVFYYICERPSAV